MTRRLLLTLLLIGTACTHHKRTSPAMPQTPTADAKTATTPPPAKLRPVRFAGTWYPANPTDLGAILDADLARAKPDKSGEPVLAVVSPHPGIQYGGEVAGTAIGTLRGHGIERVFLIGPSHTMYYRGIALPPDWSGYATPVGDLPIDRAAVDALRGAPGFTGPTVAQAPEHSLEMVAIFVARALPGVRIVPLVVGDLGSEDQVRAEAARIAALLQPTDAVVVSSDFTHYGPSYHYVPFTTDVPKHLQEYADEATAALTAVDLAKFDEHLEKTGDDICGREGLRLLMALLPPGAHGERVAFDTSGRETGDYTNSVSYVGLVFRAKSPWTAKGAPEGGAKIDIIRGSTTTSTSAPAAEPTFVEGPEVLNASERNLALLIARRSIGHYLAQGTRPDDKVLEVPATGALRETLAAFVTLDKGRRLRGCIGHTFPVEPLWRDIRDNAIAAATQDPRFTPVTAAEMAGLTIEVSVLTRPQPVSGPEGFMPGPDGVILSVLGRSAVFLPQVAPEQGWDRATTLEALAEKAGLPATAWQRSDARFETFQAQVFGEPGTHPGKP